MTAGETIADVRSRMVLAGGYGGWLEDSEIGVYDGFYSRPDTWESFDGYNWTLLNPNCTFGGRAWFGMGNLGDPNRTFPGVVDHDAVRPKKIYIFGGGYIGKYAAATASVNVTIIVLFDQDSPRPVSRS